MLIQASHRKSVLEMDRPISSLIRTDDLKSTWPSGHPIKRSLVQDFISSIQAPGKRSAQISTLACLNPPKKPRLSPIQFPKKSTLRPDPGLFQNLQPPPSTTRPGPTVAPQVTRKTPAQVQSINLQPPHNTSYLNTLQAYTRVQPPPLKHVPGQSLRMLFRRVGKAWWSCTYMTSPSSSPAEKPTPPAQSPAMGKKSEEHCAPGPWSVLYGDLQISSSSEETLKIPLTFFILKAYGTGRTEELGRTEAIQKYRLSGTRAPKTTHCGERQEDGGRVKRGDLLPPHRYTRNISTRGKTPTEHLLNAGRRPQTSQKVREERGLRALFKGAPEMGATRD
ncbi:putative protein FAM90A10 isoform X3 [Tursiops truncatus]